MRSAWALLLVSGLTLCAAENTISMDERMKALNWLDQSRNEFIASINGISDEQWKWKPAPDRWSVGEVAEHIVLAEQLLFGAVRRAAESPANPDWESRTAGKTELIEKVMAPRLGKAQAPEAIVPKGGMTPAEVRSRFEAQREEIVAFAKGTQVALKEHTLDHPMPVFGTLNAYQWLIYVPLHTMRHEKQIAEVKATAGYPAK